MLTDPNSRKSRKWEAFTQIPLLLIGQLAESSNQQQKVFFIEFFIEFFLELFSKFFLKLFLELSLMKTHDSKQYEVSAKSQLQANFQLTYQISSDDLLW